MEISKEKNEQNTHRLNYLNEQNSKLQNDNKNFIGQLAKYENGKKYSEKDNLDKKDEINNLKPKNKDLLEQADKSKKIIKDVKINLKNDEYLQKKRKI